MGECGQANSRGSMKFARTANILNRDGRQASVVWGNLAVGSIARPDILPLFLNPSELRIGSFDGVGLLAKPFGPRDPLEDFLAAISNRLSHPIFP